MTNTANNSQPHPSRRTLVQITTLNLAAGRRGPSPSPSYCSCSCLWRWWRRLLLLLLLRVAHDLADALVQLLVQRVIHLAGVAASCHLCGERGQGVESWGRPIIRIVMSSARTHPANNPHTHRWVNVMDAFMRAACSSLPWWWSWGQDRQNAARERRSCFGGEAPTAGLTFGEAGRSSHAAAVSCVMCVCCAYREEVSACVVMGDRRYQITLACIWMLAHGSTGSGNWRDERGGEARHHAPSL